MLFLATTAYLDKFEFMLLATLLKQSSRWQFLSFHVSDLKKMGGQRSVADDPVTSWQETMASIREKRVGDWLPVSAAFRFIAAISCGDSYVTLAH